MFRVSNSGPLVGSSDAVAGYEYRDLSHLRVQPEPTAIAAISVRPYGDHVEVVYKDASGQHTIEISHADLQEWGRHKRLWSKVFVQHHFDEGSSEDYESVWSWHPFREVEIPAVYSGLSIQEACAQINADNKQRFIQSVNEKTMEDYLCQLQPHKVES